MRFPHNAKAGAMMLAASLCAVCASSAQAGVSAEEAAKLNSELTPLGGERAGNKDGSIPAWTGGYTTPMPGFVNGGRRGDPFAADKPIYSVNAKNMAQYADKLTEGTKALLTKYPETFRVDVYPTRRTAAAPQWIYDNTAKNAVQAKLVDLPGGPAPQGAYGGVPFPIPKSGTEVMWNHLLRWQGESLHVTLNAWTVNSDGKRVLIQAAANDQHIPYYVKDGAASFNGTYWQATNVSSGPPLRAGEALVGTLHLDDEKTQAWIYLTGQRRVRKLPNPCCDTPGSFSAGVTTFDEVDVFWGRLTRFDWKIVGKKEMLVPYNSNKSMVPTKDADLLGEHHLNPDHVRWELHRVWVVDAELKPGQRHVSQKTRYYVDEDTWNAEFGDRYDAKGQLSRIAFGIPMVMPDMPATFITTFGVYDLNTSQYFVGQVMNEQAEQYKVVPRQPEVTFTPDGMTGASVR